MHFTQIKNGFDVNNTTWELIFKRGIGWLTYVGNFASHNVVKGAIFIDMIGRVNGKHERREFATGYADDNVIVATLARAVDVSEDVDMRGGGDSLYAIRKLAEKYNVITSDKATGTVFNSAIGTILSGSAAMVNDRATLVLNVGPYL